MSVWIATVGCALIGVLFLIVAAYINVSTENELQKKEITKLRKTNDELEAIVAKRAWGEYE